MKVTKLLSPCFDSSSGTYLNAIYINNVELDICPKTGGIWFDRFEIKKFDEVHEDLRELLLALPKQVIKPDIITQRRSPKHPEAIMQQQAYGPKGAGGVLSVDICPISAGIWLDYLEIEKIRALYPKESDREASVKNFVNQSFKIESTKEPHSALGISRLILYLAQKIT